jgi:hypothetical protein
MAGMTGPEQAWHHAEDITEPGDDEAARDQETNACLTWLQLRAQSLCVPSVEKSD